MTGLSRPHEPGPPDAAEWDKAAITFATEQLTRVRASATAWTGTVGTLLGLFGAVAVVGGGTTKLADVPDPALRWVIVGLVAVAGALAGISVVTGVRAAQGASLRTSDNWSGSAYRAAVVSNTADALDWLRWARWTGLGAALTVFSIGLLGLISVAAQPSKPATSTAVVVDQAGTARCGSIGRTADGRLTVNGTPAANVRDITPVTACPAS
ncbi:hypothetical protein ACFQFC_05025 [Amorphoplanes digitatis]|uniref:Uncharacterized protein n=1 Tax=Actinoplanes digitatis TaxID=1868 RepID=A0A7W7MRA6_9ACTN|nr:hypothetical protein [Actinoplanes digitatis]MBB4763552.1 hypothetical protein [Actinoplanes digitatis]GID93189.1 hypothetical protein Adi01nite_26010 [Actinoplanes digitatis]